MDVALVSCRTLPEHDPDAAPLAEALASAGIRAEVLAWEDPGVDWSRARLTVLRSTWNYPLHHEAFLAWAERAARVSELWNPLPVVRWNTHKRYLLELEGKGVPIVPTVLLERGTNTSLASVLGSRGWEDAVVKPAVSAASFRTIRVRRDDIEAGESHVRDLLCERDVLVQPYLPEVEGRGERALIWIDGALTHAVRKSPRLAGDDESVSNEAVAIAPEEATLAQRTIGLVGDPLLYARVDLAPGPDGTPVLMELELVEPSLFFAQSREALERFVEAVGKRLAW